MARRSTATSEPISIATLAKKIAEETVIYMVRFTDDSTLQRLILIDTHKQREREEGRPIMSHGIEVDTDNLHLWRFRRVSPGSWTADFKLALFRFDSM